MYRPRFTVMPAILHNIEQIGRIMGFLQAVQLSAAAQQELVDVVEAETVHASTAIEGNTLTREQVTRLLRGQAVRAIARDVQEVKNYQETLRYIREIAQHTARFTQQTILELHFRLLRGVNDEIAGRYRSGLVRVGEYQPPDSFEVSAAMHDLVDWLNRPTPAGYSPLLYAGIAHYQLVAIHPFVDGNGRTTRALTTLFLLKHGYDITHLFALESYYNRERHRLLRRAAPGRCGGARQGRARCHGVAGVLHHRHVDRGDACRKPHPPTAGPPAAHGRGRIASTPRSRRSCASPRSKARRGWPTLRPRCRSARAASARRRSA